jgi:phosphopantothenoylcysteine decarboxylase/phosphopantothenate--cysteine ligase
MHPSDDIKGIKSNILLNKKIVLGITGSIAAVENVKLSRELIRHGAEVIPVMTKAATKIIHPDSIEFSTGKKPILELTGKTEHVSNCGRVKEKADILLISPCTSNTLSKIAHGIDDNSVTTFASTAIGSRIPILIIPAMHISMYDHSIIKTNIKKLKKIGINFINPKIVRNKAKIADIEEIVSMIIRITGKNDLINKKILIIGGSTSESIDDVRFISNRSSGKTTLSFVINAFYRGGEVELWYGCSREVIPKFINTINFYSIKDLIKLLKTKDISKFDIIILCAAISDYTIDKVQGKIKTNKKKLILELKPSPKIISILRERAPNSIIVGFKLGEDEKNVIKEAKNLLKENKLNFVVANVISGIDSDKNKVWLLDENEKKTMIKGYKLKITNDIFDIIKNK